MQLMKPIKDSLYSIQEYHGFSRHARAGRSYLYLLGPLSISFM
jgi:hypothetical protein